MNADGRDPKNSIHFGDIAFDFGGQVAGGRDFPHIQCGSEGAGQSAGHTGNHMIQRRRVFRS